jgi:hypothetical protein
MTKNLSDNVDPTRLYTTGEACKLLGVSFITLKRWIYSKKVIAVKDERGRWLTSGSEIARVRKESKSTYSRVDQDVLDLIQKKQIAYLRELQISLEDLYLHEDTYASLQRLTDKENKLSTRFEAGNRWYYLKEKTWDEVAEIAKEKGQLANLYGTHPRRFSADNADYMEYSEWLVEKALILAGYVVEAKDTYYFNGRTYRPDSSSPGRPTDLDFIAYIRERDIHVGVQVKNRLEHPKFEQIAALLTICSYLDLRPILIARIMHPGTYGLLKSNRGRAIAFKRYLLQPPFPRDKFEKILEMGIPIGVYRRPPQFLVERLLQLKSDIPS